MESEKTSFDIFANDVMRKYRQQMKKTGEAKMRQKILK